MQSPDKSDFFTVVSGYAECELKIKNSKFLAASYEVISRIEAENFLNKTRKKHYNANHNCYAYSIGPTGDFFRYSDDGEPSGTAGKQIYQAINHFGLQNTLVIVTRYFGGVKLGVGPLSHAYYDSAKTVLELSEKKTIYITQSFEINADYTQVSLIKHLSADYSINSKESFSDTVQFHIDVLQSRADDFEKLIIDKTNAKIDIKRI